VPSFNAHSTIQENFNSYERVMTDIATELKERFWSSELWYREKWEMYGVNPDGKSIPDVLTDEDQRRPCKEPGFSKARGPW
jgi:hypothetical protein